MRDYLPDIMLINVERHPLDFTVRLIGTGYLRYIEKDPTGDSIHTFNNSEYIFTRFAKMLELQSPYLGLNQPIPWADPLYQYKRFDGMVLPFGDTNQEITMLLLLVNYHN